MGNLKEIVATFTIYNLVAIPTSAAMYSTWSRLARFFREFDVSLALLAVCE